VIGKYDAATDTVAIFAGGKLGSIKEPPLRDGVGLDARFNQPHGLAIRGDTLYVADLFSYAVRKVDLATREVTTLAGGKVRTKTLPSGTVEYFQTSGYQDGTGEEALFGQPYDVAVDSHGNVLVVDMTGRCLRKVTPEGVVTTVAGDMHQSRCQEVFDSEGEPTGSTVCRQAFGYVDGGGDQARFGLIQGLAIDAWDNVYIADELFHNIRKVTPDGVVSTVAGYSQQTSEDLPSYAFTAGAVDGLAPQARFSNVEDVLVDNQGVLFVSDGFNNCIRRIQ
jgi:hypothetical protein